MQFNNQLSSLLENHPIIRPVVENGSFLKVNFENYDYHKVWEEHFQFNNIVLQDCRFNSLEIAIRNNNTWITLFTNDEKLIDRLLSLLGRGRTVNKEPYIKNGTEISETYTKLENINVLGRTARVSYLLSPLYGCVIKINFLTPSSS